MNAFSRVRILQGGKSSFDVMKAFSDLDSARKMALFDRLSDSRKTFYKSVTLFWPQAKMADAKKLERFLVHSLAANDC
ncbi:MAG TPA: hypothetical protein PLF01_06855 [Alphaproteobacteria bacterium]|nr:hypothetical protein [Alphaproteobacteria bacterium]